MSKVFDVCASTGSYIGQDGQERQRWINVGAVFKNEQGRVSIKLDSIPVKLNQNGELWLSCFVPKQKQQPAQNQGFRDQRPAPAQPASQPADDGFTDDDIPF